MLIGHCCISELIAESARKTVKSWTGPEGIERYLEADEAGGV